MAVLDVCDGNIGSHDGGGAFVGLEGGPRVVPEGRGRDTKDLTDGHKDITPASGITRNSTPTNKFLFLPSFSL